MYAFFFGWVGGGLHPTMEGNIFGLRDATKVCHTSKIRVARR